MNILKKTIILLICTSLVWFEAASANQPTSITSSEKIKIIEDRILAFDKSLKDYQAISQLRSQNYLENIKRLSQIEKKIKNNTQHNSDQEDYSFVVKLWRSFIENSFSNISEGLLPYALPPLSEEQNILIDSDMTESEKTNLELLHKKLTDSQKAYSLALETIRRNDLIEYNKALLYSGKIRSKLYQRLNATNDPLLDEFSIETLGDVWKEIQIIPARWYAVFYSKYLIFQQNLNTGSYGYVLIAKEIFILFLLGFFSFGFIWFFNKLINFFERRLDTFRGKIQMLNQQTFLKYILTIISKLLPLFILFLGIKLAKVLLEKSSFHEIVEILPYAVYYILYRMCIIFTGYSIIKFRTLHTDKITYLQQVKLLKTSISIYRFILTNVIILHTIDTIVGKAIIYDLYLKIYLFLGFIFNIYIAHSWIKEIFYEMCYIVSVKFHKILKQSLKKPYGPLVSFIYMYIIILNYIYIFVKNNLDQFDFSKKISAQLFLSQIKKANSKKDKKNYVKLFPEYIQQFSNNIKNSHIIENKDEFIECTKYISQWLEGDNTQNSIILYGVAGVGKSTILKKLKTKFASTKIETLKLDSKITSSDVLLNKLKKIIGGEASNLDLLIEEWRQKLDTKIIISIDDIHNLFLAETNGFEAFKALMTIINSDIKNIFWCTTCHKYSWSYISKSLSQYQCFSKIIELKPWSAEELQNLILNSHDETIYKLSFDRIFFELNKQNLSNSIDDMKNMFFKVLWSKSNGNPSFTIQLWLKLLSCDYNKTIYVGLPEDIDSINFLDMPDEVLFICATIIKHEMLSFSQIQNIMHYEPNLVARNLKICLEKGILKQDIYNNYRLNSIQASNIMVSLKRKNYV
jgi:hypothetical protein